MKWYVKTVFDGLREILKRRVKPELCRALNNFTIRIKEQKVQVGRKSPLRCLVMATMIFGTSLASAEGNNREAAADSAKVRDVDILKGFTIGVDLAYNHSKVDHDQFVSKYGEGIKANEKSMPGEIQHKRCNLDSSLNIGYAHFYNNWYLGAAGEISLGSESEKNTIFHSDTTTGNLAADTGISGFSGGIKIKGGYYLSNLKSIAYAIAGVKWRNINLRFNVNDISGSEASLKRPLFSVGIGLEKPIGQKLSISAEWEHIWRNSNDRSNISKENASGSLRTKQRLSEHDFKIGMKYYI